MAMISLVFAFTIFSSVWAQEATVPTPAVPSATFSLENIARAEKILQEAINAYEEVNDYTAIFFKQELIGKKLRKVERIELKFQKPFRIYMKWIRSPDEGMEVIYKEGENQNEITAHVGGFLNHFVPTVNVGIEDLLATRNNRHLINETGLGEFLKKYKKDFERGKKRQELSIVIHGEEEVLKQKALKIEAILPESPEKGYYCYRSLVYFDLENKLPIKMEFYDFKNKLIENYAYQDLKLNPGLKAMDFDPQNEAYNF